MSSTHWTMRDRVDFVRMRESKTPWRKIAEHYGVSVKRAKRLNEIFGGQIDRLRGRELISMSYGPPLPDDALIEALRLPARIKDALQCGQVGTVGKLALMTPAEVFAIKQIGEVSLNRIEEALAWAGRSLR